jgi:hypothetical protein
VEQLAAANTDGDRLYDAIETLLKGPEISLVAYGQPAYTDKDGHSRSDARVQWWNSNARTLRDVAEMGGDLTTESGEPYPELPELVLADGARSCVYTADIPVFYGHYWRHGVPEYSHDWTDHTACVDFSAVKPGGTLVGYRWSGETTIDPTHYVCLGGR